MTTTERSTPVNPAPRTVLIVNGDDFGRSLGINRGILEAFDDGILTSTSLMTLWPASASAASASATRPELAIGLHVDLGEWIYSDGTWSCTYLRTPLDDESAVQAEVDRQLAAFRRLLGREPTHLDSHQHVHRDEPTRSILAALGAKLQIPVRQLSHSVRSCGVFFGQTETGEHNPQAVTVEALLRTLASLPAGTTELACHPGYANDVASAYRRERELEVRTLCDRRVRDAISDQNIVLRSFATFGRVPLAFA